ncbi:MAG: homoserine dehydrogenase [Clostridia bacterium]|nr:homoserine dehydrogenase [Clostridia bacterium]
MKKVAVVGFGNIGQGVCRLLKQEYEKIKAKAPEYEGLKYICDLRSFPDSEYGDMHITDFDIVCRDPEIDVVIEVTGARRAAYEISKKALAAKKNVVTSNKEVVSAFGEDLLRTAEENGVYYLFEAAVGGTIPIIRPLRDSLSTDDVKAIYGVVNGTTNYILTEMSRHGCSFEDALKNAQRLGFAEPDPTADITGKDAARKIVILAACATGRLVPPETVITEGVEHVKYEDLAAAEALGGKIKLVAFYEKTEKGMLLGVKPCFVSSEHMLYCADGVNNGILVRCKNAGDVLFSGLGAGPIPTAAAIIYDAAEAMSGISKNYRFTRGETIGTETKQKVLAIYESENKRTGVITDRDHVKKLEAEGIKAAAIYETLN